jgi:hypothetical protein
MRAYEDLVEIEGFDVENLAEVDHALVHGNDLHGAVDLGQLLPDGLLVLLIDQVQLRQEDSVGKAHLLDRFVLHACSVRGEQLPSVPDT